MTTESPNPGKIINHIAKDLHLYYRQHLKDLDMGWGQFKIVLLLMHGEGIRQEDISTKLEIDKTTVTRTLNKLEASGFIERKADPKDKRAHRIFLTEKSRQQKAFLTEIRANINTHLLDGFEPEEIEQLMDYLTRLKANSHILLEDKRNE